LKSRGMAHSNQLREFTMSENGIKLVPAYIGPGGVLTGSSRLSQEAKEKADARLREQETQRKQQEIERKRLALQAQIASLQAEFAAVEKEADLAISQEEETEEQLKHDRNEIARKRMAEQ
jgi:circadian clock protein KaiC